MTATSSPAALSACQAMLWDHLADGVACLSADGRVLAANPALARWLQAGPPEALCGRSWSELLAVLAQRSAADAPALALAADDRAGDMAMRHLRLIDGRHLVLSRHLLPGGTHLVQLREQALETTDARQRADFLARAGHDLRTPLASLVGYSELLAQRPMAAAQVRELAAICHRQATALSALLADVMDLARLDACGARDFRCRPLAAAVLVADAARAAGLREGAGLTLTHAAPDAALQADATQAVRALTQVLAHACRGGAAETRVDIASRLADQAGRAGVEIQVSDDGPGLTPEEQCDAFARFSRRDEPRTAGTGLGLSLARMIVELHGGHIGLTRRRGQGATITLWWPAAPMLVPPPGIATDATHFPALVTGPSSGANWPRLSPARARRPRRSPPANLLKGGSDEPDDQRAPSGSYPRVA